MQTTTVFLSLTSFDLFDLNRLYCFSVSTIFIIEAQLSFFFLDLANKNDACQVVISGEGANMEQEEFVETQYYKKLESINKQHHTVLYLHIFPVDLF